MNTPSSRPDDLTGRSSITAPTKDSTPLIEPLSEQQIEEAAKAETENTSSKSVDQETFDFSPSYEPPDPVIGSRLPRFNWWRPTLALAFAAGLVYIVVEDPPLPWVPTTSLSLAQKKVEPANQEVANLIIYEATPSPVDQPVSLGVSVDKANDEDFLVISGLPKGTTLSAGHFVGDDGWSIRTTEIKDTLIQPPPHFIGVMELSVSLIVGQGVNTSEGRPIRFEWVEEKAPEAKLSERTASAAKTSGAEPPVAKVADEAPPAAKGPAEAPPVAVAEDAPQPIEKPRDESPSVAKVQAETPPLAEAKSEAAPAEKAQAEAPAVKAPAETPALKAKAEAPAVAAPTVAQAQVEPLRMARAQVEAPPVAKSESRKTPQLSPEEAAALLKRGNDLIASGDLAAARLVLRRAAEAGNARAAFALAGTYNPITLEKLQVHGLTPDLAIARHWYEKARELGSTDASRELQILPTQRN